MLNLIHRLSLDVSRTGTIRKAAFIRAEEACDILADITDLRARSQLEQARGISWLIPVIVDARSQLEYARRDKSEGVDKRPFRSKVASFSNL